MPPSSKSFHIGKVRGYLRGQIWYLSFFEQGRRRRPRVGPDRETARQLAAQINTQLEVGALTALSFQPISIPELRQRWLDHHEQVLRTSVMTIRRYRAATDHLLRFLQQRPVRQASQFHANLAEEFVCYLRQLRVSPNGHANTPCRPLMDKGLRFILECCRTLFNFAAKRRHLSPYAENPFVALDIDRIPVEQVKPICLFSPEQERAFLEACDDWQFPIFLTLILTGLRPGELCHLLLPDDLDLDHNRIRVQNKPRLGWRVKTRNEREMPLIPVLARVLRYHLGTRQGGLVFRGRNHQGRAGSTTITAMSMEQELGRRQAVEEGQLGRPLTRDEKNRLARKVWRSCGAIREERVRSEFMRITQDIGLPEFTAPKMLRHQFATALQEGRVDPLIRNELMGHVASGARTAGFGLGMTAVYTHTRPETRREQLEVALKDRVAVQVAMEWLSRRTTVAFTPDSAAFPGDQEQHSPKENYQ